MQISTHKFESHKEVTKSPIRCFYCIDKHTILLKNEQKKFVHKHNKRIKYALFTGKRKSH